MRIVRLLATATAAATLAILTTGTPALAHNSLTDAVPAKNATLEKAPTEVKLSFLQQLDPEFLTIAVTDAQKQKVPAEDAVAKGKVGTLTFSEPLLNGEYTVAYRVVSQDGHPVQGSYKFTVDDPAATPPASPSAVPSPSDAAPAAPPSSPPAVTEFESSSNTTTDSGPGWGLILAIVAVVALLAAGALFAIRRRKTS